MRNPARRNRNIGTAKQGYGLKNKMTIPDPSYADDYRIYYERLGKYTKEFRTINGHKFCFVIEELNKNSFHACSVDDVAQMLEYIPASDYGEMKLIIFRQPKRKEKILSPVWGRLIYFYEFEDDYHPAIILEAPSFGDKLKWSRKMSIDTVLEFDRLKADGFNFVEHKRYFKAEMSPHLVRNTQLFRTIPHELGHYVHYQKIVIEPEQEDEDIEKWEKRRDLYHAIPSVEKEAFAHNYADRLREKLLEKNLIPF